MGHYRRNYVPGGTYFFTLVTHRRKNILTTELSRKCLREAFNRVRRERPFNLFAIALLPDHLHSVWIMPQGDADYSTRWRIIKSDFTKAYLATGGAEVTLTKEQVNQNSRGVWQPRFWEHTCRDYDDLKRCVDYLHWNPVKHHLVSRTRDYPWSSFRRLVQMGEYTLDWGSEDLCPNWNQPE